MPFRVESKEIVEPFFSIEDFPETSKPPVWDPFENCDMAFPPNGKPIETDSVIKEFLGFVDCSPHPSQNLTRVTTMEREKTEFELELEKPKMANFLKPTIEEMCVRSVEDIARRCIATYGNEDLLLYSEIFEKKVVPRFREIFSAKERKIAEEGFGSFWKNRKGLFRVYTSSHRKIEQYTFNEGNTTNKPNMEQSLESVCAEFSKGRASIKDVNAAAQEALKAQRSKKEIKETLFKAIRIQEESLSRKNFILLFFEIIRGTFSHLQQTARLINEIVAEESKEKKVLTKLEDDGSPLKGKSLESSDLFSESFISASSGLRHILIERLQGQLDAEREARRVDAEESKRADEKFITGVKKLLTEKNEDMTELVDQLDEAELEIEDLENQLDEAKENESQAVELMEKMQQLLDIKDKKLKEMSSCYQEVDRVARESMKTLEEMSSSYSDFAKEEVERVRQDTQAEFKERMESASKKIAKLQKQLKEEISKNEELCEDLKTKTEDVTELMENVELAMEIIQKQRERNVELEEEKAALLEKLQLEKETLQRKTEELQQTTIDRDGFLGLAEKSKDIVVMLTQRIAELEDELEQTDE